MEQQNTNLFSDVLSKLQEENKGESGKYTSKIKIPVYTPRGEQPDILYLLDSSRTNLLIKEIEKSSVSNNEKLFLIEAAKRHTVFNYEKIADYYAHASPEMQFLMENSALVIIDFRKAIQYGYTNLSLEIANQYLNTYKNDEK